MAYKCDACGIAEDGQNHVGLRCVWGPHYDWQLCPKCNEIFNNLDVMGVIKAYQEDLKELAELRQFKLNSLAKEKTPTPETFIRFGDVMPLEEFIECCDAGGFTDDDGCGYYTHDGKRYSHDYPVAPSDICQGNVNRDFKYVVWFNR